MNKQFSPWRIILSLVLVVALLPFCEAAKEESDNPFDYNGSKFLEHVAIINYTKCGEKGACCGVVVNMEGKPYLLTLQSELWGAGQMSFMTIDGNVLKPRRIEVAAGSNLMRLELAEGSGLELAANVSNGDKIGVFGSNHDSKKVSELFGTVKGVGAEVLEVSAEFDEEHIGAPVLDADGKVLAVANYVRESGSNNMLKGTRFANQTRRFCCRLERVKWTPISWGAQNKKYGVVFAENKHMLAGIVGILNELGEEPLSSISLKGDVGKELSGWLASHNSVVSRGPGQGANRRKFYNEFSDSANKLASVCRSQARKSDLISESRGLTPFMQNEIEDQVQGLEALAKIIEYWGSLTF